MGVGGEGGKGWDGRGEEPLLSRQRALDFSRRSVGSRRSGLNRRIPRRTNSQSGHGSMRFDRPTPAAAKQLHGPPAASLSLITPSNKVVFI